MNLKKIFSYRVEFLNHLKETPIMNNFRLAVETMDILNLLIFRNKH